MDETNTSHIAALKNLLEERIIDQSIGVPPLSKKDFLHHLWRGITIFISCNRGNPLIQSAVCNYPDISIRMYVLFSILYGAHSCEPKLKSILREMVRTLDADLEEKELRFVEYARGTKVECFYPGLSAMLGTIRAVYGAEESDLRVLPPTPYYAYTLLTLNHPELIGVSDTNVCFTALKEHHSRMCRISDVAKPKWA